MLFSDGEHRCAVLFLRLHLLWCVLRICEGERKERSEHGETVRADTRRKWHRARYQQLHLGRPGHDIDHGRGLICGNSQRLPAVYTLHPHHEEHAGQGSEENGEEGRRRLSFKAMCTALAASIGTGNIAGVSGAIALGGPGAVFWMWLSALLGMCTKYCEVTLSVKYRERTRTATGWAVPCTTSATAWARSGPGWR